MIDKNQADYLYVLRSVVRGEHPDQGKIVRMDQEAVFQIAFRQTHAAWFYQCFLDNGVAVPLTIAKRCRDEMNHGIHREALMNVERERIFEFMDQEGIWHCPLKGIVLQPLYPMLGLRYSADNDILIDARGAKKLKEFMKARGYRVLVYGGSHHDVYIKNPSYHFEFHRRLMSHLAGKAEMDFFNCVEDRLLKDEEHPYDCRMTAEDFYLHMLTHMYEHYTATGTGLRSLVDIYYYRQTYLVDDAYVSEKLEQFGMTDFEKTARSLSVKLFGDSSQEYFCRDDAKEGVAFTESESDMLEYLLYSGACGSQEIYAENMFAACRKRSKTLWGAKLRYVWTRLFPGMDYIKTDHPMLYKYKVLIPFFLLKRLLRAIFVYHKPKTEFAVLKDEK